VDKWATAKCPENPEETIIREMQMHQEQRKRL